MKAGFQTGPTSRDDQGRGPAGAKGSESLSCRVTAEKVVDTLEASLLIRAADHGPLRAYRWSGLCWRICNPGIPALHGSVRTSQTSGNTVSTGVQHLCLLGCSAGPARDADDRLSMSVNLRVMRIAVLLCQATKA